MDEALNALPVKQSGQQLYSEKKLGKLLLDAGKLEPQDAEKILRLQISERLLFGDAAIKLGLVSAVDIRLALAQQFDYPYLSSGEGGFSEELMAVYHPFSEQVEQLRSLRSQLMLRWFAQGHKTLSIVGTQAHEGVSNLVANLAVVFSQLGERTLLIDADLREPRQHQIFNLGNRAGLSDILIGRAGPTAAVRISAFVGLSVLTAGTIPPNPSELLSRPGFVSLLNTYHEHFDVILIDTSPAANADAVTVCARTGGVLITARQDHTRIKELSDLVNKLSATNITVVGTVLNQF